MYWGRKPRWLMLLFVLFTALCVIWGCDLMGTTGGDDGPEEDAEEQDDDGITDGDDDDADGDDDSDDDSGSGSGFPLTSTFPGANAYALIDGADFGDGTADVSELRKLISVELSAGTSGDFSVPSELYAMHSSSTSHGLFLVIPVTNVSNTARGGVYVDDIVLLDDDGAPLHSSDTLSYYRSVQASVFDNGHGIVSNDWLAPNETGCAFIIELYYYPDVAALRCTVQARYADKQETNAEVIPQGYTLSADGLTITFANTGTRTVKFDKFLYWVGLDASGMPVLWGLDDQNPVPSNRILAAGESGSITDASVSYRGTIEQIVAFIDYDLVG